MSRGEVSADFSPQHPVMGLRQLLCLYELVFYWLVVFLICFTRFEQKERKKKNRGIRTLLIKAWLEIMYWSLKDLWALAGLLRSIKIEQTFDKWDSKTSICPSLNWYVAQDCLISLSDMYIALEVMLQIVLDTCQVHVCENQYHF